MNSHKLFTHEELYAFLDRIRAKTTLSERELTSDEICMAEKLVEMKLLHKYNTRLTVFYTYGVNGHPEGEA